MLACTEGIVFLNHFRKWNMDSEMCTEFIQLYMPEILFSKQDKHLNSS